MNIKNTPHVPHNTSEELVRRIREALFYLLNNMWTEAK
jgi:hypothetical protein